MGEYTHNVALAEAGIYSMLRAVSAIDFLCCGHDTSHAMDPKSFFLLLERPLPVKLLLTKSVAMGFILFG